MRAIDQKGLRTAVPQSWRDTADAKTVELQTFYDSLNVDPAESPRTGRRIAAWKEKLAEAIDRMETVWQDRGLKQALMDASFGKCWYCEAKVAQRADNAVDHFRPKSRVAEDQTHPGYWWLACDMGNYRFACQFCNSARRTQETSGGKQDHFPLWDEKRRVRQRSEPLVGEQPLLLDPTRADDLRLMTFGRDGKPAPRFCKDSNPYLHARAEASIRHYHLDRPELNNDRQAVMSKMEEQLLAAEQFTRELGGANPFAEAGYRNAVATLVDYIRPQAEFSMAARAFLSCRRATSTVADELLQTPL